MPVYVAVVILCLLTSGASAQPQSQLRPPQVIRLWPGQAPGTENWTGPEEQVHVELPRLGKVHIITNVSVPTLTVFQPAAANATGTAVVVVPGGAFRALPWDLDGLETAQWFAARGVTAFVLKYRVRPPATGASPQVPKLLMPLPPGRGPRANSRWPMANARWPWFDRVRSNTASHRARSG